LQQGEAWAGVTASNFNFSAFLPDGTINIDSQQVLFEILINTPSDYDLNTGLIDPNNQSVIFQSGRQPGAAKQSYVYIANNCTSEFAKGKFTQTITGTLLAYYPDQTTKQQQQAATSTLNQTLNNNSTSRTAGAINNNSLTPLLGSLSTPQFKAPLNNSLLNTITAGNPTNKLNQLVGGGIGTLLNKGQQVLGTIPTKLASVATPPISSGQVVGLNNNAPPPNLSQSPTTLGSNTVQSGNFRIVTTVDPATGAVYQQVLLPDGGSIASGDDTTTAQKLQWYINKYNAERPDRAYEFVNAQKVAMDAAAAAKAQANAEKSTTENATLSTPQTMAGSDDSGVGSDYATANTQTEQA
jgi:hypothetical protein